MQIANSDDGAGGEKLHKSKTKGIFSPVKWRERQSFREEECFIRLMKSPRADVPAVRGKGEGGADE